MAYEEVLPQAFRWVVHGDPATVRRLAALLLEQPDPDYISVGSSFAVTAREPWKLWLSRNSAVRLKQVLPEAEFRELVQPLNDAARKDPLDSGAEMRQRVLTSDDEED